MNRLYWLGCFGLWLLCGGKIAEAKDFRLALLVANETGWKSDPKLKYAISGDLHPMARQLRRLGFHVYVQTNRNAQALRQMFQRIQRRVQQAPRVTTFLFYYSGHADRQHLHLGPRSNNPLSYAEFVRFLQDLPVQRRIAFIDACFSGEIVRHFGSLARYRKMVRKGVRGLRPIDISKTIPHQGDQQGLQVISSSLDYSWESRDYRASVFTHYLLRGLKGQADRDQDGKISVHELFNFVSDQMVHDIRQKPHMFGVVQRSNAYALAPAYHSRLRIGSHVTGTLHISVANFVWKQQKRRRQPMRLAVVHGWGTVELRKGRRCWKQKVFLPKGGEASLHRWNSIPCRLMAYKRKGAIALPLQISSATQTYQESNWSLSFSAGILNSRLFGQVPMFGGDLGVQWKYIGLYLELWGGQKLFQDVQFAQLLPALRLEAGYVGNWGKWHLFAGGYLGAGLFFQKLTQIEHSGLLFRYGVSVVPKYQFARRWGILLRVQAGFSLGQFEASFQNIFDGSVQIGWFYRL